MTSFTSDRLARRKGFQAKNRPQPARLRVEELEDRIVPSFFPPTTNGIHILEDQLPNSLSNAMVQFVATHIDGTEKELLNQTQQFRAINPNFTVLHYQLGTGNSPFDYIINNQWASDWSYVNQQESWFVHQSYSGEPQSAADLASGRVGNSTPWNQADIANSAWQQYTLNQVFQNIAATGSNGWFADSYTYGISGGGYDGTIPTRYQGTNAANPAAWPGGITWTNQLANWAQTIENAFANYNSAHGTNYRFLPNLDARVTSWEPRWYDNSSGVPFIDGAFLEDFGSYTDTYNWTFSMNQGLNLTSNGKIVIMQPYPSADPSTPAGQQQVNFFLGTYLLLKGDETYLNIDYGGGVQYYPQYGLNLGTAVTPLQSNVSGYLWNGVYRRDFQNGFVLVNPGSTTYTLNLGGNYRLVQGTGGGTMSDADLDSNGNYVGASLTYQNMSSITLAGGSAAIFLNNATNQAPAITSANSALFIAGTQSSFTVTATGSPVPTLSQSGTLPTGITFNANTGVLSGTPAAATAGTYPLTFTASNGVGTPATQNFTLTVSQPVATISGTVFHDLNIDGLQDDGEPGIAGVTVFLDLDNSGVLKAGDPTATTDNNGNFQLGVPSAGSYTVRELLYGGVLVDSPSSGRYSVTVTSGANVTGQNFADVLTSIAVPLTLPPSTAFPTQGDANADYVEALYRAILDRNADAAGLASWTNQLNSGSLSRLQVVQGIRNSVEHFTQEVTDFYLTLLGRAPDPAGLQDWVQQLEGGMREEQIAFYFLDSPEYLSQGDKHFVDQMYLSLLGRSFDSAGEASWLSQLAAGTLTHEQVITDFLYSTESLTRLTEGYYEVFLQRQADPAGLSGWVGALQQSTPFLTIGQLFLSSDEFYNRAAAEG